ncbi:hypothetical protein HYS72_00110 [Candidatus Pacearchaeota archaeon]|nr:hypothetical protein [Candidatus Pacearchaeota archaeon]
MKLKLCKSCNLYTLKENCSKCNSKTSDAHYKFSLRGVSPRDDSSKDDTDVPSGEPSFGVKIRDVPKNISKNNN